MVRNHHTVGLVGEPWFGQIRGVGVTLRYFETAFDLLHFKKTQDRGLDRPTGPLFEQPASFKVTVQTSGTWTPLSGQY